jgi:antitoxin component YwqK of YwqJK toxin-antitoxin module
MNEANLPLRLGRRWAAYFLGNLSILVATVVVAQQSDPYRTELRPIQSAASKKQAALPSSSSTAVAPPSRLTIPTISVSSLGGTISQDNGGEDLPQPKQETGPADLPNRTENEGIVRLLKPLVVEPQNRELLTQRYPNGQVMIEREVAMDQHGNYLNEGSWKMYDMDQKLMGSGRFETGQMVGLWRRTHLEQDHPWLSSAEFRGFQAPFHSSAEFVDGKLHGLWLIKDDQERKVVELTYREGQRHGAGTWWHPNGEVRRQLSFQDNLLHGVWQEWNSEKRLLTENWFVEGQRIDKQVNNFAAERPESEVSFLEAKLTLSGEDDWWNARLAAYQPTGERIQTGPVKAWYDNGQRHMAGYYKDGQRHGEFAWWHDNGHRKLVAKYEDGQRVGKWIWWHENGIKAAEGSYVADLPIGQWTAWNDVGKITSQRDVGAERETLARPDYDQSQGEEIEELPPQLEKGNLNAPIAPSFEELELPPPQGAVEGNTTKPPGAADPANPTGDGESASPGEAAGSIGSRPSDVDGANPAANDSDSAIKEPVSSTGPPAPSESSATEQTTPTAEEPPPSDSPVKSDDPPPRPVQDSAGT